MTALFAVMVVFLGFLAGSWTTWREIFPFEPMLRPAFVGTTSLWNQYVVKKQPFDADVWMAAAERPSGVVRHDPAAADGYTLMTVAQSAILVDMDGSVAHRWTLPLDQIPEADRPVAPDVPEAWLYWRPAKMFPNGDLIAVIHAWSSTPEGIALIKVDRQSRLIWIFRDNTHHDFDIDDAGNIYVLQQRIREDRPPTLWSVEPPYLDDSVVILTPDGKEVRRVSIMDAFDRSVYRTLLNREADLVIEWRGDYLHANAVQYVSAEDAKRFPTFKAGQVIISMREIDTIAALDLETETIVWAQNGPWRRQHDPDLLEDGRMLVFDNQGDWARGGRSRVVEFDPQTGEISWAWPSAEGDRLWSFYRAGQQRLANGNVLINEFTAGRLLEVTRAGDIVWEFISPFRHQQNAGYVARIMFAERYGRTELSFQPELARQVGQLTGGE